MLEQPWLIQFFQHAHRRVDGYLKDFQDGLSQGHLDPELFERAAEEFRQHMHVEEELLFPQVEESLAKPIANLLEMHGHLCDLVDQVKVLLRQGAERSRIQKATSTLVNLLAAHSAEEELGVYPDLVSLLGPEKARALLKEAEKTEVPAEWVCVARRVLA